MAQSAIDICNSALSRVGAASIVSLTDNSPEARVCALQYDSNRRDELRKYTWNFAIKRVVLAPDTTAPAFGATYAFTVPADCLRILLPKDPYLDWVYEGGKILTNYAVSPSDYSESDIGSPALALRYIADIEDATKFDATFYNIVAIALAMDVCEKLTQSNQKKANLQAEYADAIKRARASDSIEMAPKEPADDSYWLARY